MEWQAAHAADRRYWVALAWDEGHLDLTQRVLQAWTSRNPGAGTTQAAALRQAIADADRDAVERHGDLNALMGKIHQAARKRQPPTAQE